MASVSSFIPEVWSARFTSKLREMLVWGSRVNTNFEGEIMAYGDTVKIPSSTTTITVRDYTVDTDIADAQLAAGTTQDLLIDQQKYFHFYVDDIDRLQARPDLMDDAMQEAAFQMSKQIDSHLMGIFNGAYHATRLVNAITSSTTAALGTSLQAAFIKARRVMTEANIPAMGRWAVISPKTQEALDNYFGANGASGVFLPATAEGTVRSGFSGRLYGFDLYVANSVPTGTAQATKATDRLYLGQGMEAVTHAAQIIKVENYRPEKRFGDAVKGLRVYGSKLVHANRLWTIEHLKTTT